MNRDEILAVTESDSEGCATLNELVHEKLGLGCCHRWKFQGYPSPCNCSWRCINCSKLVESLIMPNPPDYTHSIEAAWAIKEWLENHSAKDTEEYTYQVSTTKWKMSEILWASPLDRCKSFLIMQMD